eukprot:scaffold1803_cov92-Amphora_coffeaeformis.AAC.61
MVHYYVDSSSDWFDPTTELDDSSSDDGGGGKDNDCNQDCDPSMVDVDSDDDIVMPPKKRQRLVKQTDAAAVTVSPTESASAVTDTDMDTYKENQILANDDRSHQKDKRAERQKEQHYQAMRISTIQHGDIDEVRSLNPADNHGIHDVSLSSTTATDTDTSESNTTNTAEDANDDCTFPINGAGDGATAVADDDSIAAPTAAAVTPITYNDVWYEYQAPVFIQDKEKVKENVMRKSHLQEWKNEASSPEQAAKLDAAVDLFMTFCLLFHDKVSDGTLSLVPKRLTYESGAAVYQGHRRVPDCTNPEKPKMGMAAHCARKRLKQQEKRKQLVFACVLFLLQECHDLVPQELVDSVLDLRLPALASCPQKEYSVRNLIVLQAVEMACSCCFDTNTRTVMESILIQPTQRIVQMIDISPKHSRHDASFHAAVALLRKYKRQKWNVPGTWPTLPSRLEELKASSAFLQQ